MLEPWNLEISHAGKKQRRADLCKLTRRPLLPVGMLGMQQAHRAKPSATGNAVEDKRSVDFYRACYLGTHDTRSYIRAALDAQLQQ